MSGAPLKSPPPERRVARVCAELAQRGGGSGGSVGGAGAIAQVIVQLVRQGAGQGSIARHVATAPVAGGLFAGVTVMYVTGLITG